ncbi:MAG: hypothetical protein JAY75_01000, partial [Candidatus Thiodiazotropha taylori]|nr:hypothetical protein [Candidatus Thiodiazotropha taylori]MCW4306781.1 hypothetical protein [Candidatus Thiodiazotropha endolucinida]
MSITISLLGGIPQAWSGFTAGSWKLSLSLEVIGFFENDHIFVVKSLDSPPCSTYGMSLLISG